jgi:glycosyltransferase involved in cell wall biosynthesis
VAPDGDRDGIPNVLVEAMASGLPVVTTSAGGIPELVQHDVDGVLAEPGDLAALARLIAELVDDPQRRERLGTAARATVERSFDIDVAAQRLEEVLRSHGRTVLEAVR